MIRAQDDNSGVILIALLWILTAISVIALSFSRESFVEVAAARNALDLSEGYYIARAGMAYTIYQLLDKRSTPQLKQLELPQAPDPIELGRVAGTFGDGEYDVDVQDESAKINVNFATDEQLRNLMLALGIEQRDADIMVDSIMDWKDADNLHRANGGEDEFYQALNPPYKAKNSKIDTVEELLLIRGVTKQYYYGFSEKTTEGAIAYRYGLSRYLTVYSNSNRINVNYASVPVLMSIPGMPPQVAQMIYERRRVKPFQTVEEITKDVAATLTASVMPFLSTDHTGIYTLTALGRRMGSKVQRVIRAVVSLDPRESARYKFIYWNENVAN